MLYQLLFFFYQDFFKELYSTGKFSKMPGSEFLEFC